MAKVFMVMGVFFAIISVCDVTYNAWLGATGRDEHVSHSIAYEFFRGLAGYDQ